MPPLLYGAKDCQAASRAPSAKRQAPHALYFARPCGLRTVAPTNYARTALLHGEAVIRWAQRMTAALCCAFVRMLPSKRCLAVAQSAACKRKG